MTHSEETAERIIRQGLVRPLLQAAEDFERECKQEYGHEDRPMSYWLAVIMAVELGRQLPLSTSYFDVAAIILDCLDAPAFA